MKTIKIVIADSEEDNGFTLSLEGDKERIIKPTLENPTPAEQVAVLLYNECLRVLREKGYIADKTKH